MSLAEFLYNKLSSGKPKSVAGSLYDVTVNDIMGNPIDLSRYRGKKLLIVNTASKCGYTPQYADLETLHQQHGDAVTVLGFPANNFLWQEPGSDGEIAAFCQKNYGVTFTLFSKISVKGKDQHPLFKWLSAKTRKTPKWNFCKYLVSEDGLTVKFYPSTVEPLDAAIVNEILK